MTIVRTRARIPLTLLLCLIACAAACPARAQKINLPPVTRATMDNGVRVLAMEYRRAPTLSVTAIFPGGTSIDPAGKAGTASLAADLLRRGTETRTAVQIADQIDFLGASLGGGAGMDRVAVSLSVLAKDADAGLDLFADVIRHPTFPQAELDRQKQIALAGLQALAEDPGAVADRVADEVVYAGHPYGTDPTMTSLAAIARDDVAQYYHSYLVPNRMILVAVGALSADEIVRKLRARFGDWPRGADPALAVPPVPAASPRFVLIDKPDATQTQVRLVRPGFPRSSPDYFPARIADTALGGSFTSRLTDEVRVNRKLTYGISSEFGPALHGGSFEVSSFTKIETTRPLIDATRNVLDRTATKGFSAGELKRVKGYLAGLFAIRVQTPEALAQQLGDMAFYNLPDDYLKTYLQRLNAVTPAQAAAVARKYFGPNAFSTVLVAPAGTVRKSLQGLGNLETRPVDAVAR